MFEINLTKHLEKCAKKRKKGKSSDKKINKRKIAKLEPLKAKTEVDDDEFDEFDSTKKNREIDSTCPICLRRFYHEATLKRHMEMHTARIPGLNEKTPCPVWGCELVNIYKMFVALFYGLYSFITHFYNVCLMRTSIIMNTSRLDKRMMQA